MSRVALFVPDLLFGSNLLGALQSSGHDASFVQGPEEIESADVDVVVVDLTVDAHERIERLQAAPLEDVRKLAFYAHVEADVRELAERSGFDLVVPRSRMAREGPALVARLSG